MNYLTSFIRISPMLILRDSITQLKVGSTNFSGLAWKVFNTNSM